MSTKPLTLRPYQLLGQAHILQNQNCALFMGMGLGKTATTLSALDLLSVMDDPYPALIVAPKLVAQSVWPGERAKWTELSHMEIVPLTGSAHLRQFNLALPAKIHTINYENLEWLMQALNGKWPYKTIVCDESTKLKSFRLQQGGKRARALGKIAHLTSRWINLTGTPASNGLIDLWGQTWFLDRGQRLGRTYQAFKERWFHQIQIDDNVTALRPTAWAQDEIHDKLRDICLAIDPKDWFDLKEPIVNDIYVDIPPKARQIYSDMKRHLYAELANNRTAMASNGAAKSQKLLQLANGAVYLDPLTESDDDPRPRALEWQEVHDVKLQALHSIVEESAGAPLLVAYQFKSDRDRLMKAFPYAKCLQGASGTLIDAWNKGNVPMLLAHPQSAGHGLNLQDGGNTIVFFGFWWSREQYAQIIERIGPVRQAQSGHNRPVFIHRILARDSIDEDVVDRLEGKKSVDEALINALKRT